MGSNNLQRALQRVPLIRCTKQTVIISEFTGAFSEIKASRCGWEGGGGTGHDVEGVGY